jgi:hypothetical protein
LDEKEREVKEDLNAPLIWLWERSTRSGLLHLFLYSIKAIVLFVLSSIVFLFLLHPLLLPSCRSLSFDKF